MTSTGAPKGDARTLHQVLALMCVLAVALLLPHGIISHKVVPVLAIVPMTASLLYSVLHLSGRVRSTTLATLLHLSVIAFLLGTLSAGLVEMVRANSHRTRRVVMLGTYGTVPCLVSMGIHLFLLLRRISFAWVSPFGPKKTCPHCDGALSVRGFFRHRSSTTDYGRVPATDDDDASEHSEESHKIRTVAQSMQEVGVVAGSDSGDPRPSTDDETARLV